MTTGQTLSLPAFGFGGAPLGELYQRISDADAQASIDAAWAGGVRLFDTAPWYGHGLSEHRLGRYLREQPREQFLLSTKVGRVYAPAQTSTHRTAPWVGGLPFVPTFDYSRDGILRSWEDSLQRLGLQRVDMLVIHDLDSGYHGTGEVFERHKQALERSGWQALQDLRDRGAISAIGAGINDQEMIPYFVERFDLDFLLVAMPYTLLDQKIVHDMLPLCLEKDVAVIIGAPFASGILATGAGQSEAGASTAMYNYAPASAAILEITRRIEAIADRHGVRLAAAALQFPLAHEAVRAIVPGAISPAQVRANLEDVRAPIPADFWVSLKNEGLLDPHAPVPA